VRPCIAEVYITAESVGCQACSNGLENLCGLLLQIVPRRKGTNEKKMRSSSQGALAAGGRAGVCRAMRAALAGCAKQTPKAVSDTRKGGHTAARGSRLQQHVGYKGTTEIENAQQLRRRRLRPGRRTPCDARCARRPRKANAGARARYQKREPYSSSRLAAPCWLAGPASRGQLRGVRKPDLRAFRFVLPLPGCLLSVQRAALGFGFGVQERPEPDKPTAVAANQPVKAGPSRRHICFRVRRPVGSPAGWGKHQRRLGPRRDGAQ
jgi:hypothetical protein